VIDAGTTVVAQPRPAYGGKQHPCWPSPQVPHFSRQRSR
jgi:hypothetical protein